ncbi:hypothetical protein BDR04DRAFT_131669 [Suillus decipiens]|nr:hypothetical protein BDR04DRAFT_131669 [Suillus decipiens]
MQYSRLKTGLTLCSLTLIPFSVLQAAYPNPPVPSNHVGFYLWVAMTRAVPTTVIISLYFSLDVLVGQCLEVYIVWAGNVLFQGYADKILWRAASLGIVLTSVSLFLLYSYVFWVNGLNNVADIIVFLILSFTYTVARIILIALMLKSLRSLPPGVYDTVAWTNFIPHL